MSSVFFSPAINQVSCDWERGQFWGLPKLASVQAPLSAERENVRPLVSCVTSINES